MDDHSERLVRCVGAIIHDASGRLLLVCRATEPGRGRWSVPGGKVRPGEADQTAVRREVREETGLEVAVGRLLGSIRRKAPGGAVFDIHDYAAHAVGGVLQSGDDAADVRWVDAAEYHSLPVVAGLTEALRGWSVLPR